ncbi:ABC transporter substrate-binding protein [Neptunomonas concharum]|uniref:ABC transporter substrate-binding protein n=1 Tax=Neptunomonas concharum TaxID=1031538 RepID=A0A5P1RB50_9GAMM|nr:ABC transporter substrate-binding protein [Neptunomonas concharum]QEQ96512.1 ABC transporter substrate-binding protein [Neptunomonas concharum]
MKAIRTALFSAITGGLLAAQVASAQSLTVVAFGGASQEAQRTVFFKPFSTTSGNQIVEDSYNGGLAKVKAMVDSNSVTWDVLQVEDPDLLRGCESGLFEKMDWDKLGDKGQYLESAISECGMGHIIWSNVIAYNRDTLKTGPKNWQDFWDVNKYPGKRGLRKGAKGNLEFALLADGVKPDEVYSLLETEEGVNRAFAKLDELKPYIQWWEAGAQPPEWLASGDVVMTTAYNGRITNANKEGKNFQVVWDGQLYSVDSWAVIKGSKNKDKAFDFIAYASSAKVASQYPAHIPYGVAHKEATQAIPEKIAKDLPTYPDNLKNALREDTAFWVDYQDELNERFNAWVAR